MLFDNKRESNLRSCIKMIEESITSLGHKPDDSRLDTQDDLPAWRVEKGSAHVYIMLLPRADENFLRVTAPVVTLGGKVDRTALFQRLLELNAQLSGGAFALKDSVVLLTSERSTIDLDKSEVLALVGHIEETADHWDDVLAAEFQATRGGGSYTPVVTR